MLMEGVPGSLVECGVWRGGSSGIMGTAAREAGRFLHLFDSFEGLPEPGALDGDEAVQYSGGKASGELAPIGKCDATLDTVKGVLFERFGLDPQGVRFHVGWFQNTVPRDAVNLGPIAVLRLDGDWYESTKVCLEHLYPALSARGVLILDDYYCWEGCRKAAEEYRAAHAITAPIQRIDRDAAYWIKP